MCRYAMCGPYKQKWACFQCRKSYKSHHGGFSRDFAKCPQCQAPLGNMGLDFRAPRQTDTEDWRKVALLFENGINFSSCGCSGPGLRPARLRNVPDFLEQREQNAANWQRQRCIEERAAELKARRKKRSARNEARRIDRLNA